MTSSKSVINIKDIKATKKLNLVYNNLKDLESIMFTTLNQLSPFLHYIPAKNVYEKIKVEKQLITKTIKEIEEKVGNTSK